MGQISMDPADPDLTIFSCVRDGSGCPTKDVI